MNTSQYNEFCKNNTSNSVFVNFNSLSTKKCKLPTALQRGKIISKQPVLLVPVPDLMYNVFKNVVSTILRINIKN